VEIDPSLFVPEDKEAVEDLIVAAIKTAQERAQEAAQAEMAKATEGLPLPPGMKLPF
jgi:DNA-binding protein YbaB